MAQQAIQDIGNQLRSALQELEKMRGPILRNMRFRWASLILTLLGTGFFVYGLTMSGYNSGILILSAAVGLFGLLATIVLMVRGDRSRKKFALAYKRQVYPRLLETIDPNWKYSAEGVVDVDRFRKSGLFTTRCDVFKGDDLVTGRIDKVEFQCSEVHAQKEHIHTDEDGGTSTSYSTIFKGLFFAGWHQMDLQGRTTILPHKKKSWITKTINRIFSIEQPEKVEIRDAEFSELFMVHSTHPYEAENLIGHLQITTLKALAKWVDPENIRIAFLPHSIFCAISFKKDLFEPRLRGSLLDLEELHHAHELFTLNKVLVQGLVVD